MRIGILTFQWAINYGAILQMYALKTYLEGTGNNVYIIDYSPKELRNLYSLNVFTKGLNWKERVIKIIENLIKKKQYSNFNKFLISNFKISEFIDSSAMLNNIVKDLDIVIVGSDQVWNKDITKTYLKDYLLYDINCNKISYAASIGSKNIRNDEINLYKKSLDDYIKISVRENFTGEQLHKILPNKKIEIVLDPVFLLSKEEWNDQFKIKIKNINNKKYILIYMLEYNQGLIKAAEKLHIKTGLPIYSIEIPYFRRFNSTTKIKFLHGVGPDDFVYLISNAEYVLTNSFHGTAFSLIFEKMFISFVHSSGNLRLENLLEICGLQENQIDNSDPDINEIQHKLEISNKAYKDMNIISELINNSKDFLSYL